MKKYDVVGIGANVCDTLITIPHYPKEDTKIRATSVKICGGGPCATGLVASSKLGAKCAFIGTLANDEAGRFLLDDMKRFNIDISFVELKEGASFTSFIWISEKEKTRTCVFNKDGLPAFTLSDAQKQAIADAKVLLVDGNELENAIEGAKTAKKNGTLVIYDAGGLYPGVEKLLPYVDILIPSEEFSIGHTGKSNVRDAAEYLHERYSPELVVITQGKKGGLMYDGLNYKKYPALPATVVDSNGAGDVFHGAFAYALSHGISGFDACILSSAASAIKCTKFGSRDAAPTYEELNKYLKEQNYELQEKMEQKIR